ncbi:MAG: HAMP domain-containing sensor histidine kinase, partial [Actinomycetota bacterium]
RSAIRLNDDVMEHLLDDLRTLSTAQAGMLRVHREPTDLVRLTAEVLHRFETEAGTGGVDLISDHGDRVEAEVDPVRVREVIGNLVRNAIRATAPGGRVTVALTGPPSAPTAEGVTISVADTGRGIAADDVERVFDRFHKGPESDGTGLGLTISRDLVEAHGGSISLRSEEGVGTTVLVSLPSGPAP